MWVLSAHWGQNWGSDESHAAGFVSSTRDDILSTSQRPIFNKFRRSTWIHVPLQSIGSDFPKYFCLEVICPPPKKTQNLRVSNRYLTLTSPQPRGCSPRERENFLSVFLYDIQFQSYGASNFTIFVFCLFFPYKMPKSIFVRAAYSPGIMSIHCRMLQMIPCGSGRAKRVTFANGALLRRLMGEPGSLKLPSFSSMGNFR